MYPLHRDRYRDLWEVLKSDSLVSRSTEYISDATTVCVNRFSDLVMSCRKLLAAVVFSIYSCALASGVECANRPDSEKYTCWVVVIFATSGEDYYASRHPECKNSEYIYSDIPCNVHVGAEVTVQCQSDDVQLFFNDEPLGTGHSATFSPVGYEQSGHYDCRNDSGNASRIVYERTMTVTG